MLSQRCSATRPLLTYARVGGAYGTMQSAAPSPAPGTELTGRKTASVPGPPLLVQARRRAGSERLPALKSAPSAESTTRPRAAADPASGTGRPHDIHTSAAPHHRRAQHPTSHEPHLRRWSGSTESLDEQGGGLKLASLGDYGIDHHRLLDQLQSWRPVIDRQELRVKSIEKIAMERHAVVFEQLEERIKILQKVSLFNHLSDNELRRAASSGEDEGRGTFVFKQGEVSDDFYVVASVRPSSLSDGKSEPRSLTEGRFFYSQGPLTPRLVVKAKPDKEDQQRLELLKLSGVKFRALFESRPDLLKDNSNTRERQAWCIIGNCPLFAGLDEDRLRECVRRVKVETHDPGSVIINEGHTGSVFYIIVDGIVKVVHEDPQHKVGERPVRELGDGTTSGRSLLVKGDSSTRGATVVAVFKCTLAV